jgi:hypothetical protein
MSAPRPTSLAKPGAYSVVGVGMNAWRLSDSSPPD